jgi:hypothetical protein
LDSIQVFRGLEYAAHTGRNKLGAFVGALMIDPVLNLLFRCSHRHFTRPVAPITKAMGPFCRMS